MLNPNLDALIEKLTVDCPNIGLTYNQTDRVILYIPFENTNNPGLLTCMVSLNEDDTEETAYDKLKTVIDDVLGMDVLSAGERLPLSHPWMVLKCKPCIQSVTHTRFNVGADKKLCNSRGGFLQCEITDQTGLVHKAFTDIKHFPIQTQQYLLNWKYSREEWVDCISNKIATSIHDLIHSNYNTGWINDDSELYQIMLTNEVTGQTLVLLYKDYHSTPAFIEEINETTLEEDIVYALSYLDDAGEDIFHTLIANNYLKPKKVIYVPSKDKRYVLSGKRKSTTENHPMDKLTFDKTEKVSTSLQEETPLTPNKLTTAAHYELPKCVVRVTGNQCVFNLNNVDESYRVLKYLNTLNTVLHRSKDVIFSVSGNHVTFSTVGYNHCSLTIILTNTHKFDERNLYGSIVEWLFKDDLFIVLAIAALTEDGKKYHPDLKAILDEVGIGDIVITSTGKSGYIASSNGSDDIPF